MQNIDHTINQASAPPPLDPAAPAAAADPDTAQPYRLLGLCLSLFGIGLIATLYAGIAGTLAAIGDALAHGWTHPGLFLKELGNGLSAGEGAASLHFALALSLVAYLAFALAILTFARLRGGKAWRALVAWRPWSPLKAGRTYWLIAGAALFYGLAANVLIAYFYPPSKDWFKVPNEVPSAVLLFLLAVVFAPIAEELLFRGWIYTSLRARLGLWTALLISSALFAAAHYDESHIYALAVFPIGLALGGLREVTGSLKASISFHAFFNTVAFGLALLDLG